MINLFKLSLRQFYDRIGINLLSVTVLSIGLSLVVSAFSLVSSQMWSTPPNATETLYGISRVNTERDLRNVRIREHEYIHLRENSDSFETFAAYKQTRAKYYDRSVQDYARYIRVAQTSWNFFELLNVKPILGRLFDERDIQAGATPSALLSYSLWQDIYDGEPNVIGRIASIYDGEYTIVGVMPQGFTYPSKQEVWVVNEASWATRRGFTPVFAYGSLKPAVTASDANAELALLVPQMKELSSERTRRYDDRWAVEEFNSGFFTGSDVNAPHIILICAILVLIISSINVSNLVLAKLAKRQSEFAILQSLGARSRHIFLAVFIDVSVVIIPSLFFSWLLSQWTIRFTWSVLQEAFTSLPNWWAMKMDWRVFTFSILTAIVCLIFTSLIPAIRATSINAVDILKDDSRTSSGFFIGTMSKILVGFQVFLSGLLICVSINMNHVVDYLTDPRLPFNIDNILGVSVRTVYSDYPSEEAIHQYQETLRQKLLDIPSTEEVAYSFINLGVNYDSFRRVQVEGEIPKEENEQISASNAIVSNDYFNLVDAQLVSGRFFEDTDTLESAPVVIINNSLAKTLFENESPLGKRIRSWKPGARYEHENRESGSTWTPYMRVIGVVTDLQGELATERGGRRALQVFIPSRQRISRNMRVLIKTSNYSTEYHNKVAETINRHDPNTATLSDLQTVADSAENGFTGLQVFSNTMKIIGLISLFLASVGLYGVVNFLALQRTRELGIRKALGATERSITQFVMKQNLVQLVVGILIGIVAARFMNVFIMEQIGFSTRMPAFPLSYLIGFIIISIVCLISVSIPAVLSARKSPSECLRYE